MTQRPEKNQKIFTWGYAHICAGGGGARGGRLDLRIWPEPARLTGSKTIMAYNAYYVKFIM